MIKIDLYTIKGTKSGDLNLPKEFASEVPVSLLAQARRVYEDNLHTGLHQAKTRSEVNRTTKKVYKQKGTGGARHGSRRAPIFVGGGVALGPRAQKRELGLSDKLRIRSKMGAMALIAGQKQIVGLEGISKIEKTKEAGIFIKKISEVTKSKRFTFLLSDKNAVVLRFLKNLGNSDAILYKNTNAFNILTGGTIILDSDILDSGTTKKVTKKS